MKFINKLTAKKYTCHDLGGTWICNTDYYGGETLLVADKDFKTDFKIFNALERIGASLSTPIPAFSLTIHHKQEKKLEVTPDL